MPARAHNILVVDDNDVVRAALRSLLEGEGFQVILAESGAEALRFVAEEAIDLVILDVRMPGLSGLDVLASLRRSYAADELPVIMATALDDSEDVVKAFELGANDYVTKPFENAVVLARIRTRLSARAATCDRAFEWGDQPLDVGPGSILEGKYHLEAEIGEGQFGVVFRARQVELQRPVAVKVLRAGGPNQGDLRARFQQEGMSACLLEHPNAVTVLDFSFTESGVPYLVMELLEGRSLDEEITRAVFLKPSRCAEILRPACDVLAEAHALGIVHRDVKPANLFLHAKRGREVVKILDFGLATLIDGAAWRRSTTGRGIGPGTPLYMAPERFCDLPCDGRSDVYSLGVMLFEMLAGRPPFLAPNGSPLAIARMHLEEPPPALRDVRPEIPEAIDRVVASALAKAPEERPDVAGLARDFAAALGSDGRASAARGSTPRVDGVGSSPLC